MDWLQEHIWTVLEWAVALVFAAKSLLPGVGGPAWARRTTIAVSSNPRRD